MESGELPSAISIIGSGEMSRALATRLHGNGFYVTIGSRVPDEVKAAIPPGDIMTKVKVTSIEECIQRASGVVMVAIHAEHHRSLRPFEEILAGKILVDCSNVEDDDCCRTRRQEEADLPTKSVAGRLTAMFPKSHVVKAFNTVSADIMSTLHESWVTYVCGEDRGARDTVRDLACRLGLTGVDAGGLEWAARLEAYNRRLLPEWTRPSLIATAVTIVWTAYTICRHYWLRKDPYTWDMFPTYVLNKTISVVAVTLLALVYLPGALAALVQLTRGTKRTRFHWSLDTLLRMRRQLGLYALLFAAIHGAMSVALLSPTYYKSWFHATRVVIPANHTSDVVVPLGSKMNWVGETCVLLGILCLAVMAIIGITSINSVASSLSWREWHCLQSYVGLACLALAVGHTTVKGVPRWAGESWATVLQGITFLGSLLPWLTLGLRLVLLTPCVYDRLKRIRRGGERRILRMDSTDANHSQPDFEAEL